MAKSKKLDVVALVKDMSRTVFRDMPKAKRIQDKRRKKRKYPEKLDMG